MEILYILLLTIITIFLGIKFVVDNYMIQNKQCIWMGIFISIIDFFVFLPFLMMNSGSAYKLFTYIIDNAPFTGEIVGYGSFIVFALRLIYLVIIIIRKTRKVITKKCFLIQLTLWAAPIIILLLMSGRCIMRA